MSQPLPLPIYEISGGTETDEDGVAKEGIRITGGPDQLRGAVTSWSRWNSDQHRMMNGWDCVKDAMASDAVRPGAPTAALETALNLIFTKPPADGGRWKDGWKNKLNRLFYNYVHDNHLVEHEVVLERLKKATPVLPHRIFFGESGMGAKRVASSSEYIEVLTAAMNTDEGPGTGSPLHKFPRSGTLLFDRGFFDAMGFTNPLYPVLWTARTTQDEAVGAAGAGAAAAGPFTDYRVDVEHPGQAVGLLVTLTNPDTELRVGNPKKNSQINSTTPSHAPPLIPVLVLLKELGDTMQTASYWAFFKYVESIGAEAGAAAVDRLNNVLNLGEVVKNKILERAVGEGAVSVANQMSDSAIMLTADKTVHYRNIIMGLPSVYTGSKEHVITGRLWMPITDEKQKLGKLLDMEFGVVNKQIVSLKQRFITAHLDKNFHYIRIQRRGSTEMKMRFPPGDAAGEAKNHILNYLNQIEENCRLTMENLKTHITDTFADAAASATAVTQLRTQINTSFKPFLIPLFINRLDPIVVEAESGRTRDMSRPGYFIEIMAAETGHQTLNNLIRNYLAARVDDQRRIAGFSDDTDRAARANAVAAKDLELAGADPQIQNAYTTSEAVAMAVAGGRWELDVFINAAAATKAAAQATAAQATADATVVAAGAGGDSAADAAAAAAAADQVLITAGAQSGGGKRPKVARKQAGTGKFRASGQRFFTHFKATTTQEEFTSNEKFIIFMIKTLFSNDYLGHREIYIIYCRCLYYLEKYNNHAPGPRSGNYYTSSDKYAYYRLERALKATFIDFIDDGTHVAACLFLSKMITFGVQLQDYAESNVFEKILNDYFEEYGRELLNTFGRCFELATQEDEKAAAAAAGAWIAAGAAAAPAAHAADWQAAAAAGGFSTPRAAAAAAGRPISPSRNGSSWGGGRRKKSKNRRRKSTRKKIKKRKYTRRRKYIRRRNYTSKKRLGQHNRIKRKYKIHLTRKHKK